jgi:Arylsulfotransferase (ASST)
VEGAYGIKVEVKDAYSTPDHQATVVQMTGYKVQPVTTPAAPCAIPSADSEPPGNGHKQTWERWTRKFPTPTLTDTPHPLVKMLTVPSCLEHHDITTQAFDVKSGTWKDLETRACLGKSKTQNFLIGAVRGDSQNNICVRYKVGGRRSASVGAKLGNIPSSIRLPVSYAVPTGHEDRSNTDYNLAVFMNTSRLLLDVPDTASGGPCCDASDACVGTSCCSDPSKGPSWQTAAQKRSNCWATPLAIDVTDQKPLWYWSTTTLGSLNPQDPNAPWTLQAYNGMRMLAHSNGPGQEIDAFAPSFLHSARNEEGRLRDPELLTANVFRQVDIAGNPLWETSSSAINARLPVRADTLPVPYGAEMVGFHHDALRTANGDMILQGYTIKCLPHVGPGSAVSGLTHPCPPDANRNPQQKYLTDLMLVVDRNGNVKWHWTTTDHLGTNRTPPTPDSAGNFGSYIYCLASTGADAPACNAATETGTPTQGDPLVCIGPTQGECPVKYGTTQSWINGLTLDRDGNLIISVRYQAWVVKVALNYPRSDGDGHIIWKLGRCKDNAGDQDDPSCFKTGPKGAETQGLSGNWFSWQHNPTILNDGSLLLFDNENIKCRTDSFDPIAQACRNGWTDCNQSYTSYDPHTCPFASRGQRWSLDTDKMIATPTLNFSFPQLDTPSTQRGTPTIAAFSDKVGSVQKLPRGGYAFDLGSMIYTGVPSSATGSMGQSVELSCIDDNDPCTLAPVRIVTESHILFRAYRMPHLYLGISGIPNGHDGDGR